MRFAALALALVSCVVDHLTVCDGYECAAGEVCDVAHRSCAAADQLTACDGIADFTPCMTSVIDGVCRDGVCIHPGCGNRVVDPGELCDDGNNLSGDGCSADCTSLERCGDGAVDTLRGEQCDDGGLANHDGCNSQCELEAITWRAIPLRPTCGVAVQARGFDPVRRTAVIVQGRATWEIRAHHMAITSVVGPRSTSGAIAYDMARGKLVLVGATPDDTFGAWTWETDHWVADVSPHPVMDEVLAAAYDASRGAIVLVSSGGKAWTWDGVNLVAGSTVALQSVNISMAYDEARARVVLFVGGSPFSDTWELVGDTWTNVLHANIGPENEVGLVYDAGRGAVLAIGGADNTGVAFASVLSWNGATWASVATSGMSARKHVTAGYDPVTGHVAVFGGISGAAELSDYLELDAAGTWIDETPLEPADGWFSVDARDRPITVDSSGTTSMWNGTDWIGLSVVPAQIDAVIFDPVRGTTLGFGAGVWRLDAAAWSQLSPQSLGGVQATTYDPSTGQLDELTTDGSIFTTDHDGNTAVWSFSDGLATQARTWIAYDATNHGLVVLDADGTALRYDGSGWVYIQPPGSNFSLVQLYRRRSIVFVPNSVQTPLLERRGAVTVELEAPPLDVRPGADPYDQQAFVDPFDDSILVVLKSMAGRALLIRTYTSALPDESCVPGEDRDGDGLSGCDDPDCWLQCTPQCPFGVSC